MRRQWSLRVVLVMLGAALCLGGCGTKNKDTAEANGITTEQNKQATNSDTNVKGVSLTSETFNIGGYKIKFPEYSSNLRYQIYAPYPGMTGEARIVGMDFMGSYKNNPFYICASSYTKDSGIEPVSDLDSCVAASAKDINGKIGNIQNYFLSPKVVITEQKKVTVNGREMLKAYGYVDSKEELNKRYGVIEYYTMIDKAPLSDGTKMARQAYWFGLYEYEDDSKKAEMENYLDAMAESFEETEK